MVDVLDYFKCHKRVRRHVRWWALKNFYISFPKRFVLLSVKQRSFMFYSIVLSLLIARSVSCRLYISMFMGPPILAIWLYLYAFAVAVRMLLLYHPEIFMTTEHYEMLLKDPHCKFFVVPDDQGIRALGCILVRMKDLDTYVFEMMRVCPKMRGTGLSQRLLRAAEGFAREKGGTIVELYSPEALSEAHSFYSKNGYVVAQVHTDLLPAGLLPGLYKRRVYYQKKL